MSEQEAAIKLANIILDQPWRDPDDDLSTLSRQLLRRHEEISDLREKLRISEENRKFLSMQVFTQAGERDASSEALQSALAGETASEAISAASRVNIGLTGLL
jgi:hypothetical protein